MILSTIVCIRVRVKVQGSFISHCLHKINRERKVYSHFYSIRGIKQLRCVQSREKLWTEQQH